MDTQIPEPSIPKPPIPEATPTPKQRPNPKPKPDPGMPPPDKPDTGPKEYSVREATIERLEAELRKRDEEPSGKPHPDLPSWVREQLKDLAGLLKSDPAKVKSEYRRLNLQLTFHPTEAEPRAH